MNQSFCVLPFHQTVIRNTGSLGPCCVVGGYAYITADTIQQYWNGDKIGQMRQKMLDGEACPECEPCYKEERLYGRSLRLDSHRDHHLVDSVDIKNLVHGDRYLGRNFPTRFEMHVGNLCNLKCLTCRPQDSSAFLTEDLALKISSHDQARYQIADKIVESTIHSALDHGIEVLDLRGGESMLVPAIRQTIDNLPSDHGIKTLRLQTNCTVLDDFWKRAFKKFERVEVMMSIDAHGPANEYIRYPSDWSVIERNVDYFRSCDNLDVYVNCTISNLNVLVLKPLIEWCDEREIYLHHSFCRNPALYHYTNLPAPLFELAIDRLTGWAELESLAGLTADDRLWSDFCRMIDLRESHRRNSIFDIIPEFQHYWSDK